MVINIAFDIIKLLLPKTVIVAMDAVVSPFTTDGTTTLPLLPPTPLLLFQ